MTQTARTIDEREKALLARYATFSRDSIDRKHPEPPHPYRGPFQRDRDRIVHCSAFRRLSGKMQVFNGQMGDYHRTRLTHTMEVASIARTIGRALSLNEDLIETLSLIHDIGHPPFGHAGETRWMNVYKILAVSVTTNSRSRSRPNWNVLILIILVSI